MDKEKIIKSSQEQAVASWVNYLNQIRIDRLIESLRNEQINLDSAIETINKTLGIIRNDIVNNGEGRGGIYGMHGFIAEVAECGIGNAKEQIEGKIPIYEWINDNGPADIKRGTDFIQQKFVNSGNHLSLQAIMKHFQTYPDFLDNGGVYQIPSDHYEKIHEKFSNIINDIKIHMVDKVIKDYGGATMIETNEKIAAEMNKYLNDITVEELMKKRNKMFHYKVMFNKLELANDIDVLNLSQRSYNCLKRVGVYTIGDLINKYDTFYHFLTIPENERAAYMDNLVKENP